MDELREIRDAAVEIEGHAAALREQLLSSESSNVAHAIVADAIRIQGAVDRAEHVSRTSEGGWQRLSDSQTRVSELEGDLRLERIKTAGLEQRIERALGAWSSGNVQELDRLLRIVG